MCHPGADESYKETPWSTGFTRKTGCRVPPSTAEASGGHRAASHAHEHPDARFPAQPLWGRPALAQPPPARCPLPALAAAHSRSAHGRPTLALRPDSASKGSTVSSSRTARACFSVMPCCALCPLTCHKLSVRKCVRLNLCLSQPPSSFPTICRNLP